jgi:hypoxanthine phosphoribosyltransferase
MNAPSKPEILLAKEEIKKEVARLAQEISRDYQGKYPLLLGILKGSFVFMADIIRLLEIPVEIDFVRVSSYGSAKVSSDKITVVQGLRTPVKGRDVLIIEDIVDTGLTVGYFLNYLRKKRACSLRLCTLLDKPSRRIIPLPIHYLGLTIPNRFVVGYGMDYNEQFRNLPDLYFLDGCG